MVFYVRADEIGGEWFLEVNHLNVIIETHFCDANLILKEEKESWDLHHQLGILNSFKEYFKYALIRSN